MTEEYFWEVKQAKARKEALALLAISPWITDRASQQRDEILNSLSTFLLVWVYTLYVFPPVTIIIPLLVLLIHTGGQYLTYRCFSHKIRAQAVNPDYPATAKTGLLTVTQQVLILLMGALPGIMIGFVCGVIYLLTGVEVWGSLSRMFISLNTLTLLPLYPLDGGKILLLIFPRRMIHLYWLLDLMMLVVFVVIVMEPYPMFSLLITVPVVFIAEVYRLNQITHKLLKRGLRLDTPGESIPPEAAELIVDTVQEHYGSSNGSEVAKIGLDSWLRLKTQPADRVETLCLLAIQLLALASMLLAGLIFPMPSG